jgi:hypothetical protein
MQIVLVLIVIAAAVIATLCAVLVGSLIFGGLLLTNKRARVFAPIFFAIVPATVLGAAAGAVIVGYLLVRANDNLIFLGPLGGLVAGGVTGFALGLAGALFWWWRLSRNTNRPNQVAGRVALPARTPTQGPR